MPHFYATTEVLAKAFTEWERRYREEPEQFADDMQRLALDEQTYGELCGAYLMKIMYDGYPPPQIVDAFNIDVTVAAERAVGAVADAVRDERRRGRM